MKIALFAFAACLAGQAFAAPDEALTPGQMEAAAKVFVGDADCDMKQRVSLSAIPGRPGRFELRHLKARYELAPEETRTGAVRLEDRKTGMVWLQIPAKSMLLDTGKGSRVVDGCRHLEQKQQSTTATTDPGFGLSSLAR